MKRLTLNAILACVALAAGVITASGQMGWQAQVKFSAQPRAHASVKFGAVPAVACGGVTNIKEIENKTSGTVGITSVDYTPTGLNTPFIIPDEIPPNGVLSKDLWVPWADDREQFTTHYIYLWLRTPHPTRSGEYSATPLFFIWQTGEYVRYVQPNGPVERRNLRPHYVRNAPRVPGVACAGGERRIIISTRDNKPVFRFEKYNP